MPLNSFVLFVDGEPVRTASTIEPLQDVAAEYMRPEADLKIRRPVTGDSHPSFLRYEFELKRWSEG